MKKTFGVRIAACLIALLMVSANASAAYSRDGEFEPIQKIKRTIERIWRGLGDTLTLPKP